MKGYIVLLVSLMLVAAIGLAAPENKGKPNQLYLYEKTGDPGWDIVEDGAWGKLHYDDYFVFNGHGLEAGVEYTLLRVGIEWTDNPVCLGTATVNNGGNVHIAGEFIGDGEKVWLILTDDFDCDNQNWMDWNYEEYLFENNLI
ncbi:MAG: hypothetical protein ACLFP2_02255 [Candidatus Woesearchaeota archaeon]